MRSDLWSTSDALSLSLSLVNDDETDERFETTVDVGYGKRLFGSLHFLGPKSTTSPSQLRREDEA